MEEKEVIKVTGFLDGQNVKGNSEINFSMTFPEGELANALQFVAAIGKRLKMIAFVNGNEDLKYNLGVFSIDNMKIDKNANCKVKFKSSVDQSFVGNFSKLLVEEASILLKCKIM